MIRVPVRVKSNKVLIKRGKEHLRAKVPQIAVKRLREAAKEIKRRMSVVGKPSKRPVKWDNKKQRIYVMITLRKAKNIPYKRTHQHRRAFVIKNLKSGFSVENTRKASINIYGDIHGKKQSRIHQNRHPVFRKEVDKVMRTLPKTVQREMVDIVGRMPKT